MHNLVPVKWSVNNYRSNYTFGEIPDQSAELWMYLNEETSSMPSTKIDLYSEAQFPDIEDGKFEPRESVKGDVSRSIFYFYTMYRKEADQADPMFFEEMRETLLEWHLQDEVDSVEYVRNQRKAVYQDGKLNPFILDCTLASRAFGFGELVDCDGYTSIQKYDYTYNPKMYIYPNPVDNILSIYGMNTDADEIRIHDLEGGLIQTIKNIFHYEVYVGGYIAGTYVMSLYRDGKRLESMKWVKG